MAKHKNSSTQVAQVKPEAPAPEQQVAPVMEPVAQDVQAELARLTGMSAAAGAAGMGPEAVPANGKKVNKTPRERFLTVAPSRVNKAAVALRNLARCFGAGYQSEDRERNKVLDYLEPMWEELVAAATGAKAEKNKGFSL